MDSFRRDRAAAIECEEVFVCRGANSAALSISGSRFSIYRLGKSDGEWFRDDRDRMAAIARNSTHGRNLRTKLLLKAEGAGIAFRGASCFPCASHLPAERLNVVGSRMLIATDLWSQPHSHDAF